MAAKEETILQIIPAPDWFAVYDQGGGVENAHPIVCFALVETTERGLTDQNVHAMCADDEYIGFAKDAVNFLRVEKRNSET